MGILRADRVSGLGGRNAIDGSLFFNGYQDGTLADFLFLDDNADLDMGTGEFTFEAWIKPVEHNGTNSPNYMGFFCSVQYGVNDSMTIQVKNDGKLRYIAGDSSDDETGSTVLWGSWNHVAIVRSGSTIKGYVNGIEEISSTYASAVDFGEGGGTVIGELARDNYPGDYPYRGFISNLRLIKGSALYTAAFTPPTEKLTAVDGTVLLCCQDSNDATQEATGKTIYPHGGTLPSGDNNIILNGTFWSGTDFWYGDSGAGVSASGNVATVTNGGGDYLFAIAQSAVLRIGGKYRIRGTIVPTMSTSTYQFRVRAGGSAVSWYIESGLTSGSSYDFDTGEVTADGTTLEIGSGNLANNSITQFTLQNVVVTAIDPPKQVNENPLVGVDDGLTFEDNTKFDTLSYLVPPGGTTTERGRGRGVWAGGRNPSDSATTDYIAIQSGGTAQDFGDLSQPRNEVRGLGSSTRGIFGGGRYPNPSVVDTIDYITLATTSNATDFGNLTTARAGTAPVSNETRGVFIAGFTPSNSNIMDYVTIASTGNATDFGDTLGTYQAMGRCMSPTRGCAAGNYAANNLIEYITIGTTGNSTDFGDLTVAGYSLSGTSSNTRGLFMGGEPGRVNVIDYITIASTGNAADFGDLIHNAVSQPAATGNSIRAVYGGGYTAPSLNNNMEYVTIATLGNALDYGDLSEARNQLGATSDSHGGLS